MECSARASASSTGASATHIKRCRKYVNTFAHKGGDRGRKSKKQDCNLGTV